MSTGKIIALFEEGKSYNQIIEQTGKDRHHVTSVVRRFLLMRDRQNRHKKRVLLPRGQFKAVGA